MEVGRSEVLLLGNDERPRPPTAVAGVGHGLDPGRDHAPCVQVRRPRGKVPGRRGIVITRTAGMEEAV